MHFRKIILIICLSILSLFEHALIGATILEVNGLQKTDRLNLKAEIIKGTGTLDANNVSIDCDEFQFTGTIRCQNSCTINAKKTFNRNMFKQEGPGNFTINMPEDVIVISMQGIKSALWKLGFGLCFIAIATAFYYWVITSHRREELEAGKVKLRNQKSRISTAAY